MPPEPVKEDIVEVILREIPEFAGNDKRMLLDKQQLYAAFPKMGVGVGLNAAVIRQLVRLCNTGYTQVVAIIIRGFLRLPDESSRQKDAATVDVRVILLNAEGKESTHDYTLLCHYQPLLKAFEVMNIS